MPRLQIPTRAFKQVVLYGTVLLEAANTLIRADIPLSRILNRGSRKRYDQLQKEYHENRKD